MRFATSLLLFPLFLALSSCQTHTTPEKPVQALAKDEYFVNYIKPIFAQRCVSCHRGQAAPAGLSLVQRSGLYAPLRKGKTYVIPGNPGASLLLNSIDYGGSHPRTTPRVTGALSDLEMGALHEWIEDGAYWPENPKGFIQPTAFP